MSGVLRRLPDSELEIMQVIWALEPPGPERERPQEQEPLREQEPRRGGC